MTMILTCLWVGVVIAIQMRIDMTINISFEDEKGSFGSGDEPVKGSILDTIKKSLDNINKTHHVMIELLETKRAKLVITIKD